MAQFVAAAGCAPLANLNRAGLQVPPPEGRKHQVTGDLRSHCRWRIGDVWPNLLQSQGARNLQHLSWTSVADTPPVVNIEVPMWIPRSRYCGHFRVAGNIWRWSLPEFGQETHRFKWIRYALRLPISCQTVLWFFLQLSGGPERCQFPRRRLVARSEKLLHLS
ncbi:uncharacterized protein LOC122624378 [Drosophila teissieri]|uniref:uncharacterized protein LOC122624378 n=1 Tax=Drosophila teissieri TaxID=7243 RepID=UPI001CBA534A|nr:uncharacterized protein LOC122624378 [Drosophila teissieri]